MRYAEKVQHSTTKIGAQINDVGLAFGRSSATGWGPHWRFASFGLPVSRRRVHHKKSSGLLRTRHCS